MPKAPFSVGWTFDVLTRDSETPSSVHFSATGTYSVDYSREVTRSISGLTLLPHDKSKIDLSSAVIVPHLVMDGVRYPMSKFVFTEDVEQKDVVLNAETNEADDMTSVALGDLTTLMLRNDGNPQTLYAGFVPTNEMVKLVQVTEAFGVSVEADESSDTQDLTWDGSTTDLAKVRQLAELAGHMYPWLDNYAELRSVSSSRVFGEILELEKDIFLGESGSISITNNYLTIPNRVLVTSNSSANYEIRGQWDAPSSWPSSAAKRGYVRTLVQDVQGVQSNVDAENIAATIGRRLSARKLTLKLWPTPKLDGPRVIKYKDAYWIVQNWSLEMGPGGLMDVEAEEYFMDDVVQVAALYTDSIL